MESTNSRKGYNKRSRAVFAPGAEASDSQAGVPDGHVASARDVAEQWELGLLGSTAAALCRLAPQLTTGPEAAVGRMALQVAKQNILDCVLANDSVQVPGAVLDSGANAPQPKRQRCT